MCLAAGVNKCGIEEIDKFQTHLTDYQICVVSLDHLDRFIYKGDKKIKKSTYFMPMCTLTQLFQREATFM